MSSSENPELNAADYDEVAPEASAMIESMRAYGYTTETAMADLIDNSIAAHARNVWIQFEWNGEDSWISIIDDGSGMTEEVLRDAMRLGSMSPLEERDPSDLGRFGLGLKTASLSQCRRLTVASVTGRSEVAIRRWDLDYIAQPGVDGWRLLKNAAPGSEQRIVSDKASSQGTVVLWELLDRIVDSADVGDTRAHDRFLALIERVEEHLSMVFHCYLSGSRPRLKIFLNGDDIESRINAWDPFLESHPATVSTPAEKIPCGQGTVIVRGFVLPHKDKLGVEGHRIASGPAGWNSQQGFYVYRNDRMLVPGSWLGLGSPRAWTQEEHYKLARVRIDLTNNMDAEWQLDVKKSTARPPAAVRARLRELAGNIRKQAREVFSHRGTYGPRPPTTAIVRAWKSVTRSGQRAYKIDRKHPLVHSTLSLDCDDNKKVEAMLKVLEETVPVEQIWLDKAEEPENTAMPFEGTSEKEIRRILTLTYEALREQGHSDNDAKQQLRSMAAFKDYEAIIETLVTDEYKE